jgi:exodeoxyribonuclease-3
MNVAIEERDLARPKENRGRAGFTDEERAAFRRLLDAGFVDAFREFEQAGGHYTWWSFRGGARRKNVGWRIDYTCISSRLRGSLREAFLMPHVLGSDHCPAGLRLG